MKVNIYRELKDRRGIPSGSTLGEAIVAIIDTTSVAGIQAAGNPRLLARVAERIDSQMSSDEKQASLLVTINGEEEKALRAAIMTATNLQYFYHRSIMALLWPDELEDDERNVLLGKKAEAEPEPEGTAETKGGNGKAQQTN